jgi:hypothetical protein
LNDERDRLDAIEVEMVEWRPNVMSERRERLAAEAEAARVAEQERLVKELELARIAEEMRRLLQPQQKRRWQG